MKKIILILLSALVPSLTLGKIRIDNKSDAWVFVTSEWDVNNKQDRLLAPNSTQTITQDGALIKRKFTVKFVADPEVIPPYDLTDSQSFTNAIAPRAGENTQDYNARVQEVLNRLKNWQNQLQIANVLVPQNGTLDQIVTIFGAIDPKTQRFNLRAVNKIAQDADKE